MSAGDSDLNVWKYNEQTCLDWLLQKVKVVSEVLQDQDRCDCGAASHFIKPFSTV